MAKEIAVKAVKKERAEKANQFLEAIAGCGRKFFAHNGRVSRFEVDDRGRVWYIDGGSQRRIYTHYKYQWRGFTEGGTLFDLVKKLRDYIRTGELPRLHLGPYPEWVCGGDPWAYGDDMQKVRAGAERCGLVPHNTI